MKRTEEALSFTDLFIGTTTVGERGQVVIPAAARKEYGFSPGDKLLVMAHPFQRGVMLFKTEALESFVAEVVSGLSEVKQKLASGTEKSTGKGGAG